MRPKLSDLFVDEPYRRQGIGSALIKRRKEIALHEGFAELYTSIDPNDNPNMVKMVLENGFAPITKPYSKTATFYKKDGTPYQKTYTRIDYRKKLAE